MSLSPHQVNATATHWRSAEEPELVAGHLRARAAQRSVLLKCSIIGLFGIAILIGIILGHAPDAATAMSLN